MRNISRLIVAAREMSNNQEFSQDSSGNTVAGIPDNAFVEWGNDGQDLLQAAIISSYPQEFTKDLLIPVVSRQSEYTINDNVFINNKIISVEYSFDGKLINYDILPVKSLIERNNVEAEHASYYIRYSGIILLQPTPITNQAVIRVKFYRELDDLDIRRATVSASTIVGTNLQTITVASDSTLDANAIAQAEYFSVNDAHGTPLMYKVPFSSFNTGTRVITVEPGFNYQSGETIPNGSFLTVGKWSTTHSKLANNCERFLKFYMQQRAMHKDQSAAAVEESQEVQAALNSILTAYADASEDVEYIPILDVVTML